MKIYALILAALALAACSGGSSDTPQAKAEPVVSCTSAGVCTTYPPGTTAAEIDRANTPGPGPVAPSRPTPAAYSRLPNGRAFNVAWLPGKYYTSESGVCVMRFPYTPGPSPYGNATDFLGACFATQHGDWFFETAPRSRVGDRFEGLDIQGARGEIREWEVIGGQLTGRYAIVRQLTSLGAASTWRSDRPAIDWQLPGGVETIEGSETSVSVTVVGVYGRARRGVSQRTDLNAPWLVSGVETSLVVHADRSLFAQGADGCAISGSTSDDLGGVWRVALTSSCAPGAMFTGFGATVAAGSSPRDPDSRPVLLIAARAGSLHVVIAGRP